MSKGKLVTDVNYILENGIKILKGLPLIEISRLKRHPNNIKEHPEEQIKNLMKLIKMVGFKDPIVIDKKGEIKAGHGRLDAAEKLGMARVPYIPLEGLTKKQMNLFMYMDNHVNESPWIEDNVQLLLEDIPLTELETFEVNWDEVIVPEIKEETEEIPEPPANPKTKLGDVYQLGNHKVMCGDATKDLDKLLVGVKIDLLLADPPYGMNLETDWTGAKSNLKFINDKKAFGGNKYDSVINDDKQFDPQHLLQFKEVILWGADYYADKLPKGGSWYVWDKRLSDEADKMYGSTFELCWSKIPHKRDILRIKWAGIFGTETQDIKKRVHPTQKPIEVSNYFIDKLTKKNQKILDCYLGSGSTLIACEQTNRTCFGMEIDPAYVDVVIQRWENFTGKKAKKL